MKSAILSDIHGNLPALELVLKHTKFVDRYIILGDVVNYGPWSNECVDLIESLDNAIKICGNHDEYFLNKKLVTNNSLVNNFFQYSFRGFTRFDLLKKYKKEYFEKNTLYTHTLDNKYIYKDTDLNLNTNLFVGHSHRQFFYKKNNLFIGNPGSVGQNRVNINKIDYLLHDSKDDSIELKFLNYDVNILINKMIKKGYPNKCLNYYLNKIHD